MSTASEKEIDIISEQCESEIIGISKYIFSHPETGDNEYESSAFLVSLLKKYGFSVQYPYCGIPTAFRADFANGNGKKIAFLAEYDALPGYGPQRTPAHTCGHNWIAASSVGAALILSKVQSSYAGSVVVMGTPAEETYGRKVDLLQHGAFDDIDAVFQLHLYAHSNLNVCMLAIDSWQFEFTGRASHAAAAPYNGINALDAVNLTFAGIGALRQQLKSDVRIHGIVTSGGETPNIIPAYASCRFYVRAENRKYLDEVSEKVKNCARGAALMTGAELKMTQFENSFNELRVSPELRRDMLRNLKKTGIDDFRTGQEPAGSSDIGNVSCRLPVFYGNIGVGDGIASIHEESFLKYVDSEEAHKKLIQAVKAFAYTGYEQLSDPPVNQTTGGK